MNFKISDDQGNEYSPKVSEDQIPYILIKNQRYEIVTVDDRPDWAKAIDNDPEVQQMVLESMDDIANGLVYTRVEAIQMLKSEE